MLHTFNCAAYEMAKPTYDSLIEFGIITPEHNTMQTMRWKTVELRSVVTKNKELEKPQDIINVFKIKVIQQSRIMCCCFFLFY